MELVTGTIFMGIALGIFFAGYATKDPLLIFSSGIIILLFGVSLTFGTFQFKSGVSEFVELTEVTLEDLNITTTTGEITKTDIYTDVAGPVTHGIGLIFLCVGLYISYLAWILYAKPEIDIY